MAQEDGASPKELLFEACRSNNTELLQEILDKPTTTADFLNDSRNPTGDTALHLAAKHGNPEILDMLLDQEGLEVDPANLMEGNTPLHVAVEYARTDEDVARYLVELLVEAGADPRLKNRGGYKPIVLADSSQTEIKNILQKAEFGLTMADDVRRQQAADDDSDGGPASDSD